ncbi:hypothetical protein Zmor_023157 [Zophobas morio]|uniref:Ionotropic receptor n=1 Tax=Zophobas morio TaxID=2755281 RepID=A0AA38I025_9CUCU|nr:hypothetical protein Zmor_023157 [Zophobas morio]
MKSLFLCTLLSVLCLCRCQIMKYQDDDITKCVNKIIARFIHPGIIIYVVDTFLEIPYPVIYQNTIFHQFKLFRHQIPDVYVIGCENRNINEILMFLSKLTNFNSRAKYIILSDSATVEEIFLELSKYFIYNAVVLQRNGNVITYDPFIHEEAVPQKVEPLILGNCLSINITNLFETKLPTLWRNTTIRSVYFNMFPILYSINGRLYGAAYEKLKIIQKTLKFQLKIKQSKIGPFGSTKTNGTYSSMLRFLQTREEHLMLNSILLLNNQLSREFDLSPLYVAVYQHWVVPKARILPYWRALMFTLNLTSRIFVSAVLILIALLWYYFGNDDLIASFELHYQVLLESGNSKVIKVKRTSSRILACVSIFGFFVISTIFKKEMLRIFTSYSYDESVKSVDDLVKENLPCALYQESEELYRFSDTIYRTYVAKCTTLPPNTDIEEMFTKIASGERISTILSKNAYNGLKNKMHKMGFQNPLVDILPNQVKYEYAYVLLTKGFPLYHGFLEATRRLVASGIAQSLENKHYSPVDKELKSKEIVHSQTLSFEEVSVALYVLVAGLSISICAFFLELVFKYVQDQKMSCKNKNHQRKDKVKATVL